MKARAIVEGYVSGLHRSPFRGFSVEFAEHREYVPGDDIRFLDWKVFGKTDRLYIKRYEEETNLKANLIVDCSESMSYSTRDETGISKYDYARWAAAALGYLVTQQQDAAGLVLFDERVRRVLPAASSNAHLRNLIHELESTEPQESTGIGRSLTEAAESLGRRGMTIIFSDLLDDEREVVKGLRQLRQRGHEVLLFHILSDDELNFPFQRMTRFEGMEDLPTRVADPMALREGYLQEVRAFQKRLRRVAMANRIDLVELSTKSNLGVVLAAYLARRAARTRSS